MDIMLIIIIILFSIISLYFLYNFLFFVKINALGNV